MLSFGSDNGWKRPPTIISVVDNAENELRITLADSILGEEGAGYTPTGYAELDEALSVSRPVHADSGNVYEILFPTYILHQVRNESYTGNDPYEVFSGCFLCIYTRSHLLDSLDTFTSVQKYSDDLYYPGKWTHYQIISYNHIVDVISVDAPIIRKL